MPECSTKMYVSQFNIPFAITILWHMRFRVASYQEHYENYYAITKKLRIKGGTIYKQSPKRLYFQEMVLTY